MSEGCVAHWNDCDSRRLLVRGNRLNIINPDLYMHEQFQSYFDRVVYQ